MSSAILTGSIFGDQCSPISDTSILSALSSKVSVLSHVETQLPYAVLAATVSFIAYLPLKIIPSWVSLIFFNLILGGTFYLLSTPVESEEPSKFSKLKQWFGKSAKEDTPKEHTLHSNLKV